MQQQHVVQEITSSILYTTCLNEGIIIRLIYNYSECDSCLIAIRMNHDVGGLLPWLDNYQRENTVDATYVKAPTVVI